MQVKSKLVKILLWGASLGMMGLIVGCICMIGIFYYYSKDLPDPSKLAKYEPSIVTRLYADNGKLLAEYATEHRLYLPLDAMPKSLINAFLAAEDKDFYKHTGVDFFSIARAIVTNINNIGRNKAMVGGSTITQQVVKNFLLTNERSLERKVKEAILAFRMDRIYSKDRILELYLNEIYLGLRSYGVASAALNYFNKSLEDLTIAEVAFLAGLPKGPANYNPNKNYERAINRRAYVLNRMHVNGFINDEELEIAANAPITLRLRDKNEVVQADFFAEEVRRKLADQYGADVLYKGGLFVKTTVVPDMQKKADESLRKALTDYDRRHGWRGPVGHLLNFSDWQERLADIASKTPIFGNQALAVVKGIKPKYALIAMVGDKEGSIELSELKWARKYISVSSRGGAVKNVSDVLSVGDVVLVDPIMSKPKDQTKEPANTGKYKLLQVPKVNGALVALDPHSGRVLAMSGGYGYKGSEFNRATQAKRQPGSSFKPFVYLAGLESGMTPATRLMDGPISISQGPGKPAWTPQNYSHNFLGSVPMRMGLEKSRNAMTVYLASLLGIERIQEIGKRFGIYDNLPPHYATVLGSQETTLIRIANAYSMLINGGKKVEPQLIERIDDRYGKTIFRRDNRACNNCAYREDIPSEVQQAPPEIPDDRETVVDASSAYQVGYMLQGVVQRGTAQRAKKLGMPLGGKTGTTNDSRDAWFVGFSSDLVVGLYIGFDKPSPLGAKETGGSVALPGFIDFMGNSISKKSARPFSMPEGVRLYKINRKTGDFPYLGTPASDIIYEAFKYFEDPRQANSYGNVEHYNNYDPSYSDYNSGIEIQENSNLPWLDRPVERRNIDNGAGNGWDYSTQGSSGQGFVIPRRAEQPVQRQGNDLSPNSYIERARRIEGQRNQPPVGNIVPQPSVIIPQQGYNGVVPQGDAYRPPSVYQGQQNPSQSEPNYGTGGLY